MKNLILSGIAALLLLSSPAFAENSKYKIFGQITTVDNQVLTGYITWSRKQMYWTDMFKADKPNNPYTHYFKNSGLLFSNNGNQSTYPPVHVFLCRFGNIRSIQQTTYNKIELQIRDGHSIELKKGNSNDIGGPVTIYSPQNGNTVIRWEKISKIEFMEPTLPDDGSNLPITGVIKTAQGIYKGFITWDRDEKTQEALLDGRTSGGEKSIAFKNIRQIVKNGNACRVRLHSGNEFEMWGSNDVNNQNRGIIVSMPSIGNVIIPWRHFEALETVSLNEIHTLSYNDFRDPARLSGEVLTKSGKTVKGILVFDLDEAMNFEILDGSNDNITYEIPFRFIKSIEPKNYKYSFLTLTNGSTLSLGESQDVDARNNGILIFSAEETPTYIPWKEIEKVSFY